MLIEVLIPILIFLPLLAFIVVVIVLTIVGVRQHRTDNINGHSVEVKTGYGYAQLIIDGNVVDELKSLYLYNAKLQGIIDGVQIVSNIGTGLCRYRITTFVNGIKDISLSN
ncbi:MAG: hypothetical protein K2N17_04550 [Clostridia bacterium]|nr:hypothetical protein [Clostridia bacterium]